MHETNVEFRNYFAYVIFLPVMQSLVLKTFQLIWFLLPHFQVVIIEGGIP